MSIILRILLFLIAFNVMLMIFSPYFPGADELKDIQSDPIYSEGDNLRQFEGVDSARQFVISMFADWSTIGIFAAIVGIGGFTAKVTGGSINITLLFGIAILISVLMACWRTIGSTFTNLNYNNNPTITTLFILIEIMIGIILVVKICDLLTGQQSSEGSM